MNRCALCNEDACWSSFIIEDFSSLGEADMKLDDVEEPSSCVVLEGCCLCYERYI